MQRLPQLGPFVIPSDQGRPSRAGAGRHDEAEDRDGAIQRNHVGRTLGDELHPGQAGGELAHGRRAPDLARGDGGRQSGGGDDALAEELAAGVGYLPGMEGQAGAGGGGLGGAVAVGLEGAGDRVASGGEGGAQPASPGDHPAVMAAHRIGEGIGEHRCLLRYREDDGHERV